MDLFTAVPPVAGAPVPTGRAPSVDSKATELFEHIFANAAPKDSDTHSVAADDLLTDPDVLPVDETTDSTSELEEGLTDLVAVSHGVPDHTRTPSITISGRPDAPAPHGSGLRIEPSALSATSTPNALNHDPQRAGTALWANGTYTAPQTAGTTLSPTPESSRNNVQTPESTSTEADDPAPRSRGSRPDAQLQNSDKTALHPESQPIPDGATTARQLAQAPDSPLAFATNTPARTETPANRADPATQAIFAALQTQPAAERTAAPHSGSGRIKPPDDLPSSTEQPKISADTAPEPTTAFDAPTDAPDAITHAPDHPAPGETLPRQLADPPAPTAAGTPQPSAPLDRSEALRNMAQQITDMQLKVGDHADITLSPEELGNVRLSVRTGESGLILSMQAERPETLELMRRHIGELLQELQSLGYGDVGFAFSQQNNKQDPQQTANTAPNDIAALPPATSPHTLTPVTDGLDLRL
ncbi:flagellar hook-length control protein FliK [Thalassovita taeanensis]|uniref:Hook-length control protein FliK n=1 Tax=Thalassovita taeanensis TaxID=657014 RepID=A0A1H9I9D3_9RHOB|nr:flagellar hook-length control protein FliK [Thalassovita taeanensis]SEQ71167.1 hook-length control protein FliK [Thalassovita taeanensis]